MRLDRLVEHIAQQREAEADEQADDEAEATEIELLTEIRDLLVQQSKQA